MRRIAAKFVPRLLSDDQKAHRVFVCRELKKQARDDPVFISYIITGDETWVYGYDPETKQQLSQWKLPNSLWPEKSVSSSQYCQVHVDLIFNIQGIIDKEFIPPGQTVNGKLYCEVLKQLREGIWRKRPDRWKNNNWFRRHDNAAAHTSLIF
jgi:histone-lysine N-methyltransferase SETMAR